MKVYRLVIRVILTIAKVESANSYTEKIGGLHRQMAVAHLIPIAMHSIFLYLCRYLL